ncbi:MAG TPA: type II toxin-antitoxin system VapC family toxin [Propionibacteriaceae bacterium]|jgi:hypothetical protein|nr:type II toxin-antitoxin system VapC family toxin [Propionibacteriaceae bacterium]
MTGEPDGSIAERAIYDTSVFIAAEGGRPVREDLLPIESLTTVITWAELSAGVLSAPDSATRAVRMRTLTRLAQAELLGVDVRAADLWAQLRVHLADSGRRININDLWIAAIALAHELPIVTQDNDFDAIEDFPGIRLIQV